ncbi:DEKNAAC105270 [Brettanomyces naardenensis]|uniref:DEKNAAC105270 n=1 Tax=Brettanomyces naardenensis TaxID=13370 RepID=A0A448YSW4_BRENA|nr:DEKNAAC105270 [Brettanomyces naardenensis]
MPETISSRAITFSNWRDPLKLSTIEIPASPEENQVLVKTEAVSVNPIDIIIRLFCPPWFFSSNKIVGGDFSGTVIKAGSKTTYKPSDKVYGSVFNPFGATGSFSEYLLFDPQEATFCNKIPEGMPFTKAAALPVVAGTALQALEAHSEPLKDANVLILGAGTSIGYYAIQIAKNYYGAKFVAATCSSKSFERLIQAGASKLIDYTKGTTHEVNDILEAVKGHGKFDVVIDIVRDGSLFGYLDAVLKPKSEGGMFVEINAMKKMDYNHLNLLSMAPSWTYLYEYYKSWLGFSSFQFTNISEVKDPQFGGVIEKLWGEGKLDVAIDSVWDFATEYEKAFERVSSGKVQGKVMLTTGTSESE